MPHVELAGNEALAAQPAVASGMRRVRSSADHVEGVPVFSLLEQQPGATAMGPALVEGPFFTARVLEGWQLQVTAGGDLLLTDTR